MKTRLWHHRKGQSVDVVPVTQIPAEKPHRSGHRHNPNSNWSKKHNLYRIAQDERKRVLDSAFRDPVSSEVVAREESVLLDVDQGEVLGQGIRYQRRFDILNRR